MPHDHIGQYFRAHGQSNQMMKWLQRQKDRLLREHNVSEEESALINAYIDRKNRPNNRHTTSAYTQLRDRAIAHNYAQIQTQTQTSAQSAEELDQLYADLLNGDHRLRPLLDLLQQMMNITTEEVQTQNRGNGYTASSVSSSRYTRNMAMAMATAPTSISSSSDATTSTEITAPLSLPFKWFKQFARLYPTHNTQHIDCTICCEQCVPFLLVRCFFDKNTVDKLPESPHHYFYTELVCAKCADFCCIRGIDPVRVPCMAAVPLVRLPDESIKNSFYKQFGHLTTFTPINPRNLDQILLLMTDFVEKQHAATSDLKIVIKDFRQNFSENIDKKLKLVIS